MQEVYDKAVEARQQVQPQRRIYGPYVKAVLNNKAEMDQMRAHNTDVEMKTKWWSFGIKVRTNVKTGAYAAVQAKQSSLTGPSGKVTALTDEATKATKTLIADANEPRGFFAWLCFVPTTVFTTKLAADLAAAMTAPPASVTTTVATTSSVVLAALPTAAAAPSTPLTTSGAGVFSTPLTTKPAAPASPLTARSRLTPPPAAAVAPSAASLTMTAVGTLVIPAYAVSLTENPFQLSGLRPRIVELLETKNFIQLQQWIGRLQKQIGFKKAAGWKIDEYAKLLRESPSKQRAETPFGWVSQLADLFSAANEALLGAQLRGGVPVDVEITANASKKSSRELFEDQHGSVEDSIANVTGIVTNKLYLLDASRKPELAKMLVGNLVMDILNVELHGDTDQRGELQQQLLNLVQALQDAHLMDTLDASAASAVGAPAPDAFSAGMKEVLSGLYAKTPITVTATAGSPRVAKRDLGADFASCVDAGTTPGVVHVATPSAAAPSPLPLPTATPVAS